MKRFYQTVDVASVEGGFGVLLNDKRLKTPGKRSFILPNLALAAAIAQEWAAQGAEIRPDTMPLMKLASTALDRVIDHRDSVVAETANYGASDLLCYRASHPDDLVAAEQAAWQPWLDWASLRFDAPLLVGRGLTPIVQPLSSRNALRAVVDGLDPLSLTAVADLTAATGSLILALAVWDGKIDGAEAHRLSVLDELYQVGRWGEDDLATERRSGVARDIDAAVQFLVLLKK